jgi:hypothetical protein
MMKLAAPLGTALLLALGSAQANAQMLTDDDTILVQSRACYDSDGDQVSCDTRGETYRYFYNDDDDDED